MPEPGNPGDITVFGQRLQPNGSFPSRFGGPSGGGGPEVETASNRTRWDWVSTPRHLLHPTPAPIRRRPEIGMQMQQVHRQQRI